MTPTRETVDAFWRHTKSTLDALRLGLAPGGWLRTALVQRTQVIYLAIDELHRRHLRISSDRGEPNETVALSPYELRAFSQNGEDGVLAEILRRIGAPTRFFVEFGVESGREGNCVYLADVAGWDGLFMESSAEMHRLLERKYAAQDRIHTLRAEVTTENVENLFARAGVPDEFDVLSIDVDGQDYWIWEAIGGYRPRVVVIEYNSALHPVRRLVQPNDPGRHWAGTQHFGASVGALRALADRKGYRLVHTELAGVNAFFVREDLIAGAFPKPADVAVRGAPNYFLCGYRHPPAPPGSEYLDLDNGTLTDDVQ
jgi:hypothetical protein